MKPLLFVAFLAWVAVAPAELMLAEIGTAKCVIIVDPAAIPPEKYAAQELAKTLEQITGASFSIQEAGANPPENAIFVGQGAAAGATFPDVPFTQLGKEELIMRTSGSRLLLAGGRPRGTLYAVSRFLEQECGVRWWSPWASRIPRQPSLRVPDLDRREQPAFEYREPFWFPAFDRDWAWRNRCNGQSANLPAELGGCIRYKGFVHTIYSLVPPQEHFAKHPEWFSLVKGQRTTDRAQLCLTNPQLREFMVERVKQSLRDSPETAIISVSQNDWHGACECENCKVLDGAEGTHAATLLAFVNYIAEKIAPGFPDVAVDTLAYQYTRRPPDTLRANPNVIVRLCSIECNFREPLEHPVNASFANDLRGWAEKARRLYIWDYTTNFSHYVQPHPNWFVLGPNLRFFRQHNVRGVFEQGAYQSHGSELAELRAWVLAQLLWKPEQDDRALISEFLEGYYGAAAAPFLRQYLELMHAASAGHNLTCNSPPDAPYLQFKPLANAEQLWQQAEAATKDEEFLSRLRLSHLPVRYVWLTRWTQLRMECEALGATWPLAVSRKQVADEWIRVAKGQPDKPWTRVSLLNESGNKPEAWIQAFAQDPPPLDP